MDESRDLEDNGLASRMLLGVRRLSAGTAVDRSPLAPHDQGWNTAFARMGEGRDQQTMTSRTPCALRDLVKRL
jgi:hypothetical protein